VGGAGVAGCRGSRLGIAAMRNEQEEAQDIEAEAQFWKAYDGKTDCFGTVAKLVLLVMIAAQAFWHMVTV
jgi:hypothetical protein